VIVIGSIEPLSPRRLASTWRAASLTRATAAALCPGDESASLHDRTSSPLGVWWAMPSVHGTDVSSIPASSWKVELRCGLPVDGEHDGAHQERHSVSRGWSVGRVERAPQRLHLADVDLVERR